MLTIHFGIREEEVPGFVTVFKRLATDEGLRDLETLSFINDDWDVWGRHTIDAPRHVSLQSREPMKTINFLAMNFEAFLVHSNNLDRVNARIILTENDDHKIEYEEFRW